MASFFNPPNNLQGCTDGALYGDTTGRDRLTLERFRKAVFRRLLWLYHKVGNGRITDVNRLVPRDALAEKIASCLQRHLAGAAITGDLHRSA